MDFYKQRLLDASLKTPMVTILEGDYQYIYLDSQANKSQTNKSDIVISTESTGGNYPSILVKNVKKFAVNGIVINSLHNVNPRNNTIKFRINSNPTIYETNVKQGIYKRPEDLIDAVVAALNLLTGTTGATFSKTADPNLNASSRFLLNCDLTYIFVLDCPAIVKGKNLWNLPTSQNFSLSKKVGDVYLQYTRYFDIISPELCQYQQSSSTSNTTFGGGSNLLRYYLVPPNQLGDQARNDSDNIVLFFGTQRWLNFESNRTISSISFRLIDEYGDLLYFPVNEDITDDSVWNWSLGLLVQN